MSQEDLAQKLDVTRQAVSKWEQGVSSPDIEKILLMCEIFDVKTDELLFGKKQEKPKTEEHHSNKDPILMLSLIFLVIIFVFGMILFIVNNYVDYYMYNFVTNDVAITITVPSVVVFIILAVYAKVKENKNRNNKEK